MTRPSFHYLQVDPVRAPSGEAMGRIWRAALRVPPWQSGGSGLDTPESWRRLSPFLAHNLWRGGLAILALTALSCVDSKIREVPVAEPELEKSALYREAAESVGILFRHERGAEGDFHLPEIMGAGAALFDYDGFR